jgi:hypothetical protein
MFYETAAADSKGLVRASASGPKDRFLFFYFFVILVFSFSFLFFSNPVNGGCELLAKPTTAAAAGRLFINKIKYIY